MKYTSAEAAKRLRALNEEHDALIMELEQKATFMAALGGRTRLSKAGIQL